MRKRQMGWTQVEVPVVGQGTWQMESDDRAACVEALRRGLDAGMTHVDTAELYGRGKVEEIVAEAIAGRRDQIYLVSKVVPENASAKGTLRACEASLRRLKTDRLDLYLLHWPGSHPLQETFNAFEALVQSGKILAYGVSNFSDREIELAVEVAGPRRIACNQVLYHLQERAVEHAVIPTCDRHQIAVVGYSPFGSGRFPEPKSAGGRVLDAIASRHGATARQVALSFLTRHETTFTIPKASSVKHALDNAPAGDLVLSEDDIRQIDAAFPLGPPRPGVPTL